LARPASPQRLAEIDASPRVGLLGGFELAVGGITRQLTPSAQRVVAFLALQPRPVQRVFVAGALWPDSSQERANANLRTALWRLGASDGTLIDGNAAHLALGAQVDVDFREMEARARRLIHSGGGPRPGDLARLSESADLLPDWYDDWVQIERERFRQLRLAALEFLCVELTGEGRFPEAVQAGVSAVAAEPLRESAHRALIAAHLAAGNAGEAIRQYHSCRDLLAHRLGLGPSDAMRCLVAALPLGAGLRPRDAGVTAR
jgi:DNA-binding SARP family transcriptional activator